MNHYTDFVVDSSIIVSLLLDDEKTDRSDEIAARLERNIAHAPALLRFEVSNSLLMAFSLRKRLPHEKYILNLRDFDELPIRYNPESAREATSSTSRLAEKHKLSIYDAAYLELAMRLRLPLATNDKSLIKASSNEKIEVL